MVRKDAAWYQARSKRRQKHNDKTTFMSVPPEIRNRIYDLALTEEDPVTVKFRDPKPRLRFNRAYTGSRGRKKCYESTRDDGIKSNVEPGLLVACKQIRSEAMAMFYAGNTFNLKMEGSCTARAWKLILADKARWIRSLQTLAVHYIDPSAIASEYDDIIEPGENDLRIHAGMRNYGSIEVARRLTYGRDISDNMLSLKSCVCDLPESTIGPSNHESSKNNGSRLLDVIEHCETQYSIEFYAEEQYEVVKCGACKLPQLRRITGAESDDDYPEYSDDDEFELDDDDD